MAKFKTHRIIMDGSVKNELDFNIDLNVNAYGLFTATLPEKISTLFKEKGIVLKTNKRRGGKPGFYSAVTMEHLIKQIEEDCKMYVSRKVIDQKIVIRFKISTTCSYLIDKDNNIVPNGRWLGGLYATEEKYNWRNGTERQDACSPHPYGLELYVKPFIKTTYQYASGTEKLEYRHIQDYGREDGEEQFSKGAIIAGQEVGENLWWLSEIVSHRAQDNGKLQEIDYSEPVAFFFVRFVKTICGLNESLKEFINPEGIKMLAEKNLPLLAAPAEK